MIHDKKEFYGGVGLLAAFFVVLYFMFQPFFNGHNSMEYLDNLYNSISKGSVDYVPQLQDDVNVVNDKVVSLNLTFESEAQAAQSVALFVKAGATATATGAEVALSGSLGDILHGALDDADLMYHNDGEALTGKYGVKPRRTAFNWWTSLKLLDKGLKDQEEFEAAKLTTTVQKKAVEASYNYYEVEPVKIMDKIGLVIFSLAFYVFYTLWYGFAILFIFEGWGLRLSH